MQSGEREALAGSVAHRNNFGLLRLLLALVVVVAHAWPLGGYGTGPTVRGLTTGNLAVVGFFALSGFLIARSARRTSPLRFLWHRCLRILPGFWVVLVVVAAGLAPLAVLADGGRYDVASATNYMLDNAALWIVQYGIDGTLADSPHPVAWNGSLYTLAIEFQCYALVAVLAAMKALTARVTGALAVALAVVVATGGPAPIWQLFALAFLVGSTTALAPRLLTAPRPWVPVCLGAVVVTALLGGFAVGGVAAASYLVVRLAVAPGVSQVGNRRDLSYGIYLYAFPVAQLLYLVGAARMGLVGYLVLTLACTVPLAFASWSLVESRAMRWKDLTVPLLSPADGPGRADQPRLQV